MSELIDISLDFETYYDSDYSLTKLTTIEYILDPRFEVIGFSIGVGGMQANWHTGTFEELRAVLANIDWSNARLIAHNAMFDGAILEWRFGFRPARYFCSLMGSRPYVAPYTGSASLASVSEYLGHGKKGNEVQNHRGRRRAEFSDGQLSSYGTYCCGDSDLARADALHLMKWLPDDEQYLIHLTVLKFLRPSFILDDAAIIKGLEDLEEDRAQHLARLDELGVTQEQLRSRIQFAKLLRDRGVDPPKKISKTTGKETDAFAKDDDEFIELLTHDNPEVASLVEIKLALASSVDRTRLPRFKTIYDLNLGGEHLLPVPLMYYAAHPGRFGGTDSLNLQNLPRPDKDNPRKGALRRCLKAPDGFVVMTADYSSIEARMVATLAGQWDLVAAFQADKDVYSDFAGRIYGRAITKANKVERFVGKTCILGLGYGMGWERFYKAICAAKVPMTKATAMRIVRLYRETYPAIPELWSTLAAHLAQSINTKCMLKWGPLLFTHERIILPNNMPIIYPALAFDGMGGLQFTSRRRGTKPITNHLWGGLVTENVSQALSRIVATRAEIRLSRGGLPCAHQAHDELIWVVRKGWVPKLKSLVERVMCDPVEWLPRLPIAVEIHHGPTYGDAK